MPERASQSIEVAAPPEQVMAVIADVADYPQWAGSVTSATVLSTGADGSVGQAAFAIDAGMVKDEYTLAYDWAPDGRRVDWHLVAGRLQKAQDGSYVLAATSTGTLVTYALSVDVNLPMIGLFKRRAEKAIMDSALKELKRRVETGA